MKEFYDREDFREQIKKIVNETNESIVILLAGYTGVGKSALLDYLSEEKVFNREIITVKNSSKSATSNESGYYLRTLYKCITSNQNFEKPEIYTLSSKYLFEKGKDILKEFLNLSNIKMKEDIDNPSLVFMKDFIIYTLNNVPLIINIENIQNIDAESLDYLKDILKNAQNTIFIFQYTLESEHKRRLKVFQNELMDLNVNVKRIDLNPLNFEIAKRILPNGNYTINELQDINRIYSDSHGNLIELKLYERNNDPFNQIGEKLRSLEEKYLFILYLILYSRGRIEFKKIYEIVMDNPQYGMSYMQIEHNLNYLVTNNIVEEYDRYYTVHDSIIDKLDHLILDGHKRLAQDKAYNVSLHYYMQEYSKEKTVESLFNIYYLTMLKNDPTLIQYFEEIKKVINDMHNPKELIAELEDFVFFISNTQTISVKQKDKLYCYFLQNYIYLFNYLFISS